MRKYVLLFVCFFILVVLSFPCFGQEKIHRIETLQVTAIEPYQNSYDGFLKVLEENGIVQGKNLEIKRTIIDFDVEKAGLWKKVLVLPRNMPRTRS